MNETIAILEEKAKTFDILHRSKALGIYLGESRVTAVQVSKGGLNIKVLAGGSFPNPLSNVPDSSVEEEERLIAGIMNCLEQSDGDWDEIVIGIPRHRVILKQIFIPAPDRKTLPKILQFEIERHIPYKVEDVYYCYQIVSKSDDNIFTIHLAAVKREVVDYYLEILGRAGFEPSAVDVSTNALVNVVTLNFQDLKLIRRGNVILANREDHHIEIMLMKEGELILSRSIPCQIFDETALGSRELFENFLGEEIKKTVADQSHWIHSRGEETLIILLGMENIEGIAEAVTSRTGFGAHLISSFLNKGKSVIKVAGKRDKADIHLLRDMTPLGLAINGLTQTLLTTNLMPNDLRKRVLYYTGSLTRWLIALVVMLIVMMGATFYLKESFALDEIDKRLAAVKKDALEVEKVYLKKDELIDRVKAFNTLRVPAVKKLNIVLELTRLFPGDVWIKTVEINGNGFEVLGYAGRTSTLIAILEKSDFFRDVKFAGRITHDKGKEKFRITAKFQKGDH